jgi:hypothetical protein
MRGHARAHGLSILLVLVGLLIWIWLLDRPDFNTQDGINTALSTFIGAFAAFLLERDSKNREQIAAKIHAGNKALFTIMALWNFQKQYRQEIILPAKKRSTPLWLAMQATPPRPVEASFDKDIDFLLGTKYAHLYSDLYLEEQRFGVVMTLINMRSQEMHRDLFPLLESHGIHHGASITSVDLEDLPTHLVESARTMTKGIVEHIEENIPSLLDKYHKLYQALMELFPQGDFLRINFEDEKPKPGAETPRPVPAVV